ncbi:hypothetical protein OESDEN_10414 [Oesophagostomum dentatum]|uniref:Uncharacterized protein n=1 Tax=Oesophagostomum dentatum TaxID=61180 RepID=A0A0B1SWT9_OESDE|nr:hypothetical protein OESDEN_10414 [Oesophagostomum dentatum]
MSKAATRSTKATQSGQSVVQKGCSIRSTPSKARNKDPVVEKMLIALKTKIPEEVYNAINAEKRGRSIVTSGISECTPDKPLRSRQKDLECKVVEVLDALNVDCLPEAVYRVGKYDEKRKRLIKVVLPSKTHFARALAKAHKLRGITLSNIYVRKSMTTAERAKDFGLRQEARQRNQNEAIKEWVVYKDSLKHISELLRRRITEN